MNAQRILLSLIMQLFLFYGASNAMPYGPQTKEFFIHHFKKDHLSHQMHIYGYIAAANIPQIMTIYQAQKNAYQQKQAPQSLTKEELIKISYTCSMLFTAKSLTLSIIGSSAALEALNYGSRIFEFETTGVERLKYMAISTGLCFAPALTTAQFYPLIIPSLLAKTAAPLVKISSPLALPETVYAGSARLYHAYDAYRNNEKLACVGHATVELSLFACAGAIIANQFNLMQAEDPLSLGAAIESLIDTLLTKFFK